MRKLMRDKIPGLLGRKPSIVTGDNYRASLSLKLTEETNELRDASFFDLHPEFPRNVLEEAADVVTVVAALCQAHGFGWVELRDEMKRKIREKGGFAQGYVLEFESK